MVTCKDFLPVSGQDLKIRGWDGLDVILVTGDAYVDHPSYGTALIGRVLEAEGFKVGVIAQPDWKSKADFMKLGQPRLFFGVSAGNLDSCLSNYTANRKLRHKDAYSPGGKFGLRPNRATMVYAQKIRECFPDAPIVLGGIEASLTRLAHYHFWTQDVRRSVLLDAKADILSYGMGESSMTEIARRLQSGEKLHELDDIRGTVIVRNEIEPGKFQDALELPSYEEVSQDKEKFNEAFRLFYQEQDPYRGKALIQKHANRYVIQLPPALPLSQQALDRVYELPYVRKWHPDYDKAGGVPGFETVRFSIVSHRGCSAECSFCSLYAHQGRMIQSRSRESILREVKLLTKDPAFKGTITDIGGPTANLYAARCDQWESKKGACQNKQCLMPSVCKSLKLGYSETIRLWDEVMKMPDVKHLFVASGLRYDLLVQPEAEAYLRELCANHVSGLLKVAPEHASEQVLRLMNKPSLFLYEAFARKFRDVNKELGKDQYLVNYWISAHPGSGLEESAELASYLAKQGIQPEQIQDFIPLPMTVSACMFYTGKHPLTGEEVKVSKTDKERVLQRALIQSFQPQNRAKVQEALRILKRKDLEALLLRKIKPDPRKSKTPSSSKLSDRDSME